MRHLGDIPLGAVIPFLFSTFAAATGASITLTGLAVTDIEIYKGVSMTQRASDNGYTLMDTDGIDVDGITGIHGFSVDTGDNSDAGFFASGSFYYVVVSAVTIDGQTVSFVAYSFRAVTAEGIAGQPKVDVAANAGTAITSAAGIQEIKVASIANNAITAAAIASDAITAAKLHSDVTTELQNGLATATNLQTVDDNVDAILVDTGATLDGKIDAVKTVVDAIKAKTDPMTYTVANQIDANAKSINDALLEGDGTVGNEWGPA